MSTPTLPTAPTIVDKKTTSTVDEPRYIPTDAEVEVSELELEYMHYHEMADEMLKSIVTENRKPTYSEMTFFKGRLGWDQIAVNFQLRRTSNRLRLQSIIGTVSQRNAAKDEKTKSAEILAAEGPKLDSQIAKLMEQKAALERAASQSEKRCEQIQVACDELQKLELLRADLAATYNGRKQEFAQSVWSEMNAVGVEIQFREMLLSSEVNYRLIDHIRSNFRDCIETCEHTRQPKLIGSAWEARKRVIQQELDEMRPKFEALRVIREEQEAQLDELKTFYIKANG